MNLFELSFVKQKEGFQVIRIAVGFALISLMISAVGCADLTKSVIFVTKTSIGVDIDSKPPTFNVAYDRIEGYFGPRYDNGAIPPVLAKIETDGGIFTAKVRQIYATGGAATTIANPKKSTIPKPKKLEGNRELMFFGTTTTTGLKVGFTGNMPDSFLFGFKRKEFSFIPVGTTKDEKGESVDAYPSVLALLDTSAQAKSNLHAGMLNGQFFATGHAAELFAHDPSVRQRFKDEFGAYYDVVAEQEREAAGILRCYAGVKDQDRPEAWKDADKLKLLSKGTLTTLLNAGQTDLRKANKIYATEIYIVEGKVPERKTLLEIHRKTICDLSRKN